MSRSSLNIVLLVDSRSFGGIESHIANLALGLEQASHKVLIILMANYGEHPVFDVDPKLRTKTIKLSGGAVELYQTLSRLSIDVVHTHGYKAGIIGRFICRMLDKAVVSTFHAGERGTLKIRFYRWLDRISAKGTQCISVSQPIADELGVSSDVIQNFVEPAPLKTVSFRCNQLAFVGRFSHEKGPDHFLRVAEAMPEHIFSMYGAGPLFSSLDKSKPLNMCLLGQVPSMLPHWQEIKVLCITSRAEGLPLVALEAMANGIPVVSYAVGGLPSLIDHGVNGWLVDEHQPAKFIETLEQVMAFSPNRFKLIGQNARKTILDRFSTTAVVPQIETVYRQALSHEVLAQLVK